MDIRLLIVVSKAFLRKEGQYIYSGALTDIIGVGRQRKGSEESDDNDGTARVKKLRLHLRLNFPHRLGNLA